MKRALLLLCPLFVACGGAPDPKVPSPPPPSTDAPHPADPPKPAGPTAAPDPFALPSDLRADPPRKDPPDTAADAWTELRSLGAAPPSPATCQAYAKRAPRGAVCKKGATAAYLATLRAAMSTEDRGERDARLARAEECEPTPGITRALRAELAPAECADAIVEPWLAKNTPQGAAGHALVGYALAGRLARTGSKPPKFTGKKDKDAVLKFVNGPFGTWMTGEARAIERLSKVGARLHGFGLGIAAVEAGLADMRLVEIAREGVIPDDWKDDEIKTVYYATLDQALEPRKTRGRSAALVGLDALAAEGIAEDPRVVRAHALIGKMFGGRRVDALTRLALPPAPTEPCDPTKPCSAEGGRPAEEALASSLPTFFADAIVGESIAKDPVFAIRAAKNGAPASLVRAMEDPASALAKDPNVARAYARARLLVGLRSWRPVHFDRAIAAAHKLTTDDARLVLAIALALRSGPDGAAAMIGGRVRCLEAAGKSLKCQTELEVSHVEALDALAKAQQGKTGALAAFDAAYLVSLSSAPCCGIATARHYERLAARLDEAAARLDGPEKATAQELAKDARETGKRFAP